MNNNNRGKDGSGRNSESHKNKSMDKVMSNKPVERGHIGRSASSKAGGKAFGQNQTIKGTGAYKKNATERMNSFKKNTEDDYEDLDFNLLTKEERIKYGQGKLEKEVSGRHKELSGRKQLYGKVPDREVRNKLSNSKDQIRGTARTPSSFGNASKGADYRETSTIQKGACPHLKTCGGCNILRRSYEEELKDKQKTVETLLGKYCRVEQITGMKDPTHYRNKVHAVFDHDKKGNPVSGVYEEGTHRVIPVDRCLIHNRKADEIIATIRGMLKSFKIKTYDEDTGYGLLRHVLIRTGYVSKEIMVVLVLASPILPSKSNFVKALREKHPEITTIILNVNDKRTSMVLGDKEQVLYGKGYIEDSLCGKVFRISPKSFYQVNPAQTEVIYRKAIDLAGLTGKETVIDAYCGTGTIGIIASEHAKRVIGVELNADAVRDAIINARRNNSNHIEYYNNDAGVFMTQIAAQKEGVDVVFLDPPRSGSTEQFLDALALLKPKKVVYISCNPVTLERDIDYLKKKGYKAERVIPVDMFPWTVHVETVCLLERKG